MSINDDEYIVILCITKSKSYEEDLIVLPTISAKNDDPDSFLMHPLDSYYQFNSLCYHYISQLCTLFVIEKIAEAW